MNSFLWFLKYYIKKGLSFICRKILLDSSVSKYSTKTRGEVEMEKEETNRGEWLGNQLTHIIRQYEKDKNFAKMLAEKPEEALKEYGFEPRQISEFTISKIPSDCSCGTMNMTCEGVGCPNWVIGTRYPAY